MTRAFASVAAQGHRGRALRDQAGHHRQRRRSSTSTSRTRIGVLVAPWVAAQMTDLLQAAVLTGTGRAAQIGRPVAGKTGTTSSNKDGWFLGFSSGLTTGVWMGRDDNKAIPGPAGRPGAGPRLPRFHGPRRRQPPGREFRHRGAAARMGGHRARRGDLVRGARQWRCSSIPTATGPAGRSRRCRRATTSGRAAAATRTPEDRLDQDFIDRATDRDRGPRRERDRREPRAARRRPRSAGRAPLRPPGRSGGVEARAGAAMSRAGFGIGAEQALDQAVEVGAVIHVDPVRDLVGDRRPPHPVGREDQPPAVADRRPPRSSSPSATAGRRPRPGSTLTPALAANSAVSAASDVERVAAKPAQQPRLEPLLRAADDQPPVLEPRRARPLRAPVDRGAAGRRAAAIAPAASGIAGATAASCASIQSRWPSAQASAWRRDARLGMVSTHLAGAPVDPKPHRPRRRRDAEPQLKAHARPDDARGRRPRPRRPSSRGSTFRRGAPPRGRRRPDNASRAAACPPTRSR